jgi:hypothetical protein
MKRAALSSILLLVAGCHGKALPPPPPAQSFDGVPVTGSLADAQAAGFTACLADNVAMRCRREGVMLAGTGPYAAAIDLKGSDGRGGFDHVTIWHDSDQGAVLAVGQALLKQGWRSCIRPTKDATGGEYEEYTRADTPVRVRIDVSYWGKRRLMVLPAGEAGC